jgi:hypothetical protein
LGRRQEPYLSFPDVGMLFMLRETVCNCDKRLDDLLLSPRITKWPFTVIISKGVVTSFACEIWQLALHQLSRDAAVDGDYILHSGDDGKSHRGLAV